MSDVVINAVSSETFQRKLLLGGVVATVTIAGVYVVRRYLRSKDEIPPPPEEFICPITRELMKRPVFTSDGHTYERMAIVRWLHEKNTSPKTGEELEERDIRPNHGLRAQISDYRAKVGLPALPPWAPDLKETVQSIIPPPQQQHQHHHHQHHQHQQPDGAPAMMVLPPGMLPQNIPGLPPGMVIQGGMPAGAHGVRMQQQGAPTDAFSALPNNPTLFVKVLSALLKENCLIASNVEVALSLAFDAVKRDATAVARIVMQHQPIFARVMNQVAVSPEWQRYLALAMYHENDRFAVPGQWPVQVLAVRNSDLNTVEQHVSRPEFLPQSTEAATLLVEAIWCKEAKRMTQLLLAKGVPTTAVDSLGCSVLSGATFRGQMDVVKLLLTKGADPNFQSRGGSTPLHQACFQGHFNVVSLLLEQGANPMCTKNDGTSPLLMAASRGHFNITTTLIEKVGLHSLEVSDIFGMIPISAAARAGSVEIVKYICELDSISPNALHAKTQDGGIATHHAAWCGHFEVLECLLNANFDSTAANSQGDTILHLASTRGDITAVKMLLRRKVDHNVSNHEGFTSLHQACWRKHVDVAKLLVEHGCDVHATTSNRSTPLHLAAWNGDADVMELLLTSNASVAARTRDGDTALHQAAFNNHTRCVLRLLELHGSETIACVLSPDKQEKLLDAQKCDGNTPLHLASMENHVQIIDILLSKGCDAHVKNRNGFTPLQLAQKHNRNDAAIRLQREV